MAKNQAVVDKAKIKRLIAAVKGRRIPQIVPAAQRAEILSLRRELDERLQQLFVASGLDVGKVNKILVEHQRDLRRVVENNKVKTAKNASALNKNKLRAIANRNRALTQIGFKPLVPTIIPLTEAQIFATPAGILTGTQIAPGDNRAMVAFVDKNDTDFTNAYVRFYFFWQNPSDYLAVLNADTSLSTLGVIQANATPGLFGGGQCDLSLYARLTAFVGSLQIAQYVGIDSLSVSGGSELWPWSDANFQSHPLDGSPHPLSCTNVLVESGEFILFEVALDAQYSVDDGSITMDFNFADYCVSCPGVTIELLTAPTMVNSSSIVS